MEVRIYQKENNVSLEKLFRQSLHDIYTSRFLSKQLAVRDIKAQYRQSYLGLLWAFIMPLTTAFIWVFLNKSGTITLTDTGVPYPVFAFTGTLLWSILSESINSPMASTNAGKSIMSKINFPKEALIISGIYKLLFNSFIKIVLLLFFLFFYGVGFNWTLFLFPLALIGAILFGTVVGLFITPFGMLYKDVGRIIKMGLTFTMYITPVVYAIPKTGIMKTIMELNPFTPIILTTRAFVIGQTPEYISYYLVLMGVSVPLLFLGLMFYRISIPIIVERMSA